MKKEKLKAAISFILKNKIESGGGFHILCVTGKMAAGKNFVSSILEEMNYRAVDFDAEIHEVINQKSAEIFEAFEDTARKKNLSIRNEDNSVNRRELGALLFSDSALLKKQEDILYPALIQNVTEKITRAKSVQNDSVRGIVLNAAVLYKIPELLQMCSLIVYVHAPVLKRFCRTKRRGNLKSVHIAKRFFSQKGLKKKYENSGIPIFTLCN